jgi:hypothetical protein
LRAKIGNRVATEIAENHGSLARGDGKKLDNFETWTLLIIKM